MTHLLADQKSDILGIITYYIYGNKVKVTKEWNFKEAACGQITEI
jgi:hypothetical protein